MAAQLAPTGVSPKYVARVESVGPTTASAPLKRVVAPYSSGGSQPPTVGQLWPRGNRQGS